MLVTCRCQSGQYLGDQLHQVYLQAHSTDLPAYAAGQYLRVILPSLGSACYSIASAMPSPILELHVEYRPGKSAALIELARQGGEVEVELPLGRCCLLAPPVGALILVAGGSGYAQSKSLLEFLAGAAHTDPVILLWSGGAQYQRACQPALAVLQSRLDLQIAMTVRSQHPGADHAWLERMLRLFERRYRRVQTIVSGSASLSEQVLAILPGHEIRSDTLDLQLA